MATMLNPSNQKMFEYLKKSGFDLLDETREQRLAPVAMRVGSGSGQIYEAENKANQKMLDYLMGQKMDMLQSQVSRDQKLEDVSSARDFKERMKALDWFKQFELEDARSKGQMERLNKSLASQKELTQMQLDAAEKAREAERRDNKKNILSSLFSTALDLFTGGVSTIGKGGIPFLTGLSGGLSGLGQLNMFEYLRNQFGKGE